MRFRARTVIMMAKPGKMHIQGADVVSALSQHGAPFGQGDRNTDTQEAQRRCGNDGVADCQSHLNNDGGQAVGDDVAHDDLPGGKTHGVSRFNVLHAADLHNGSSGDTGEGRSCRNGQGEQQRCGAGAENGDNNNGDHDVGDGIQNIIGTHDQIVDEAAVEACQRAQNQAEEQSVLYHMH